jgi:hypothetical protein
VRLRRSWVPFAIARRVALFAGILAGCLWITRRSVQPFSMSVLDQANNPRRPVAHDDDSVVRSCAYPYATVLGGMPWRVQGDRLLRPLHKMESQSHSWGVCITPASGGEELHLYSTQVIKDRSSLDPSSLASLPFRGNGSQLSPVPGFPRLPGRASLRRVLRVRCPCKRIGDLSTYPRGKLLQVPALLT